jgi:hypothetical protein
MLACTLRICTHIAAARRASLTTYKGHSHRPYKRTAHSCSTRNRLRSTTLTGTGYRTFRTSAREQRGRDSQCQRLRAHAALRGLPIGKFVTIPLARTRQTLGSAQTHREPPPVVYLEWIDIANSWISLVPATCCEHGYLHTGFGRTTPATSYSTSSRVGRLAAVVAKTRSRVTRRTTCGGRTRARHRLRLTAAPLSKGPYRCPVPGCE